jgi:hypothetical protein
MGRDARPTGAQMGDLWLLIVKGYQNRSPVFAPFAAAPTTINDPARGGLMHRFCANIEHKPTLERQTRREKPARKFQQRAFGMLTNGEALQPHASYCRFEYEGITEAR